MHSFRMLLQELLRPQCKAHILLVSLKIPTLFLLFFLAIVNHVSRMLSTGGPPQPLKVLQDWARSLYMVVVPGLGPPLEPTGIITQSHQLLRTGVLPLIPASPGPTLHICDVQKYLQNKRLGLGVSHYSTLYTISWASVQFSHPEK